MYNMSLAQSGYATAGKEARVMNAGPHELITIMFEELINLRGWWEKYRHSGGSSR